MARRRQQIANASQRGSGWMVCVECRIVLVLLVMECSHRWWWQLEAWKIRGIWSPCCEAGGSTHGIRPGNHCRRICYSSSHVCGSWVKWPELMAAFCRRGGQWLSEALMVIRSRVEPLTLPVECWECTYGSHEGRLISEPR